MLKNILITRDLSRSKQLCEILQQNNFTVYNEPLFEVIKNSVELVDYKKIGAVILTSFNGCEAILQSSLKKDIKIFAIGKHSSQLLLDSGFSNIEIDSQRSSQTLLKLIIDSDIDKALPILYFRGQQVNFDFATTLQGKGFMVEDVICYDTKAISSFSSDLLDCSENKIFDYVLLFSQNSALIFFNLAKKHNLLEYFKSSQLLCFSDRIVDLVKSFENGIWQQNTGHYQDLKLLKEFYE